jgi:nucleoside-diphosphate-sugar epimerase
MRKVLVTGSQGYIGSKLCPLLMDSGFEVYEFDKDLGDDIRNFREVEKIATDVDTIVHLAAIVGMDLVNKDPKLASEVNITGTKNVLGCGKRTIYASVLAGYVGVAEVNEDTPVNPTHPYYIQKLEAENLVLSAGKRNVVLRFGSLYGTSTVMRDDLLIHTLVRESVEGKVKLFQPKFMRPFTNINDAASAIAFFVTCHDVGGRYNAVSTNCTKEEIANIACKYNVAQLELVDQKDEEKRDYTVSTKKMEDLGFIFNHRLDRQIARISDYYIKKNAKNTSEGLDNGVRV